MDLSGIAKLCQLGLKQGSFKKVMQDVFTFSYWMHTEVHSLLVWLGWLCILLGNIPKRNKTETKSRVASHDLLRQVRRKTTLGKWSRREERALVKDLACGCEQHSFAPCYRLSQAAWLLTYREW